MAAAIVAKDALLHLRVATAVQAVRVCHAQAVALRVAVVAVVVLVVVAVALVEALVEVHVVKQVSSPGF